MIFGVFNEEEEGDVESITVIISLWFLDLNSSPGFAL